MDNQDISTSVNNQKTENIELNEKQHLIALTDVNRKIVNNIKFSIGIFIQLNNFTHNNIELFLKK